MQINNAIHNANDNSITGNTPQSNGGGSISDMFTTLLVAQIQNQDPLAPTDASQFVTQFAQLSQVEAMQSMASLTAAAAALQESMLVVTLGSQVGSHVMVAADAVHLDGDTVKGGFVLSDHASDVTLVLTGPDGSEHRIELGAREAGEVDFEIDPEALGLPPGKYAMRVDTNTNETVRTEIQGELQSVRLGADGRVILMVAGIGEIATSDITRFLGRGVS
ncbi:flagellar hook assembly protein FlgD [Dyella sp. M7H15-1]|uniref:flagellar hook capping FlgD N-terminal domain-containing protein n=1 Tax=Dyella sp. M7H15-1 TaxID=2501295 RepID=UPI00100503ED|nr:flagellar hook capping FlgD N-terminal domain-containing protein [Dyella sp. M7H15-1]QAU23973.1 flagellar hook assembly protein FlgD [Dyella sp. M7H15-1]